LFCQCKDNNTNHKETVSPSEKVNLRISPATAAVYQNLVEREKAMSTIARLCTESKGYRKDEWDALNECSWAVEKYQMSLHPNLVNRTGGQLTLSVTDSSFTLSHKADEYYQFVDFLSDSKHFVIRVLRPLACPEYWLIAIGNKNQKTVLPGEPIFAGDKKSFLLSSSTNSPKLSCPNEITYWSLKNGIFQQTGVHKTKTGFRNLLWYNGNSWVGKAGDKIVQVEI